MDVKVIIIGALVASVLLSVISYGLKASIADTIYLFRRPAQLLRALLVMNVLMPLFVILLVHFFQPEPLIRATLFALAVSPVPPMLPVKPTGTNHEAFVTGLLVGASAFAIIFVPLALELLAQIAHTPVRLSALRILITILVTVMLPLTLGLLVRHYAPAFAAKAAGPVGRFAHILLLLAAIPLLYALFPAIWQMVGDGTALAFAAFVLTGVAGGHLLGGPDRQDRHVLAVATAIRHPGLAIAIANATLPEHDLVPAAIALYLLISALITLPYLNWPLRRKPTAISN